MKQQKRFIVRKYVMATSAKDALKKEKEISVSDVWLDDQWKQEAANNQIGF